MGMPLPSQSAIPLTRDQVKLRSVVARVGMIGAWSVIALAIYANFDESTLDSSTFQALVGVAFLLACVLWIMMWFEFARERPVEYSYVWAFLLMTGPVLGPLLFYYRIWRTRIKLIGSPNRPLHPIAREDARSG
jgi:MFS family permease